jgi:hypothetical protein
MNFKNVSDEVLLLNTKEYVSREREMTLQILHHLKEVERRRLFASLGYSSLFDYATKELGYCAASACRRIDAMRLLKELPSLEEKIQEGKLSLSTVARAQSFFKKETISLDDKTLVMTSLENKSIREVERTLLYLSSQPEVHLQERIKPVTQQLSEVRFFADDELLKNFEILKGLLGYSYPNMTTGELIAYLAELGLAKLNPSLNEPKKSSAQVRTQPQAQAEIKIQASHPQKLIHTCGQVCDDKSQGLSVEVTPAPNESARKSKRQRSRYIPRQVARAVWKRDQGQCTWVSPLNGKLCGSTYRLQLDHIQAFALCGSNTVQNLRLLCFHHNQLEAERLFGNRKEA